MLMLLAAAAGPAAAYDPMADLVSTAKQEIQATAAIGAAKDRVLNDPRRQKLQAGFWQFFQAQRDAAPGEACGAVFWKGGQMTSLAGPSGRYRGALMGFVALQPPEGFPRPEAAGAMRQVQVSLQQGTEAPASLRVFNRSIGGLADELAVAVPGIEALLAGMEDRQSFKIQHEGRQVFALEWHSGRAARAVLQRCLRGERVDGQEVP
jgi:hypothetical protein